MNVNPVNNPETNTTDCVGNPQTTDGQLVSILSKDVSQLQNW